LASIMAPVREPGKIAGWIAPPQRGINSQPALDFEYVRL
jgi:benzoyl-CoA 2,3-epoxidase subunit B